MSEIESRKEHYKELLNMNLNQKEEWARFKIKEFFNWAIENKINEILISFSGGKDSTVLMELVISERAKLQCDIKLTPAYAMEITFPETIKFIKSTVKKYQEKYDFVNSLYLVPPKKKWKEILNKHGYPIYSKIFSNNINKMVNANTKTQQLLYGFGMKDSTFFKIPKDRLFLLDKAFTRYKIANKCCDYIKGGLKHDKRPKFIGTLTEESEIRKRSWINNGCNIYSNQEAQSRPLSLWKEDEIINFIIKNKIEINPVYGLDLETKKMRFKRLGCSSCPFGSQFEKEKNRFELLKDYDPVLFESQFINTGMYKVAIDMDIQIKNSSFYMKEYEARRLEISNWLNHFKPNFLRTLFQIENNGKNKNGWKWTLEEINKSLIFYHEDTITPEEKACWWEIFNKYWEVNKNEVLGN